MVETSKVEAKNLKKDVGLKLLASPHESKPYWIGITQEGRTSRRFASAELKSGQFTSRTKSRNREIYLSEFKWVKRKIPSALKVSARRTIAKIKLHRIQAEARIIEEVHDVLIPTKPGGKTATVKRKLKFVEIPCRYENLARVSSEISKPEMFVGKEALVSSSPLAAKSGKSPIGPSEDYRFHWNRAEGETNWSHGIRDCKVIFDPRAFEGGTHWKIGGWGSIKSVGHNSVWGIQIFEPDPKKLLEFTKTMAKRRPNDPIVIFDLYGNVFYP